MKLLLSRFGLASSYGLALAALALLLTLGASDDAEAGGRRDREATQRNIAALNREVVNTAFSLQDLRSRLDSVEADMATLLDLLAQNATQRLERDSEVDAQVHALATILGAVLANGLSAVTHVDGSGDSALASADIDECAAGLLQSCTPGPTMDAATAAMPNAPSMGTCEDADADGVPDEFDCDEVAAAGGPSCAIATLTEAGQTTAIALPVPDEFSVSLGDTNAENPPTCVCDPGYDGDVVAAGVEVLSNKIFATCTATGEVVVIDAANVNATTFEILDATDPNQLLGDGVTPGRQ